jgi:hypothetical protein
VVGVPLGLPMNLIELRVTLERPLARSAALRFGLPPTRLSGPAAARLARVRLELHDAAGRLGGAEVTAQIVDQETYRRQRRLDSKGNSDVAAT